MNFAESKAQSIIRAELGLNARSYQRLPEINYIAYTHYYFGQTVDFKNLTSTAKLSVVLELAKCDLLGI